MRPVPTVTRRGLLPAAALALVLASCATYGVRDGMSADAEKGWVVFWADGSLALTVRPPGGAAGAEVGVRDALGRPVAFACPPGRAGFLLRYPGGTMEVAVPVAAGRVTHAGVLTVPTAEGSAAPPRVTIGMHPLPLDARRDGPSAFAAGLVDADWATRLAAARGLGRLAPPLEPSTAPWLAAMAREDVSTGVRAAARAAVERGGRPAPPEPLLVADLSREPALWPLGEGLASFASLDAEGYRLAAGGSDGTAWRFRAGDDALPTGGAFDVLLEFRWVGGDAHARQGLVLGSGPSAFVAFGVTRGGQAGAWRFAEGRPAGSPLPPTGAASAAITGTTVTRLEVRVRPGRCDLVVNGEPAGGFTLEGTPPFTRLGVFADGAATLVARKIVVSVP